MARASLDPSQFGLHCTREEFMDQMVEEFNEAYRGHWTVDELLLHPQEAIRFCNDVRRRRRCYDLPDHVILRAILTRRKHPPKGPDSDDLEE